MSRLEPCKYCGGEAKLVTCDDEGNLRLDAEYIKNPWSGLGYGIMHSHEENPGCPIARYDDECVMGAYIYDSEEEAIAAWNRRPPAHMYTLEELRERNGDKIHIKFIGAGKGLLEDIVAPYFGKHEQYIKEYNGMLRATDLPLQYYGTDWAAYDRPPKEE